MQVFGLPGHVIRNAARASRLLSQTDAGTRMRAGHATAAGLPWHARMATACGQGCGKPGSESLKTAEKDWIRA